jgi:DNA polymerase
MPTVYWDFETRSAINLHDAGSYVYSIDSTTEPLCLVYAIDDDEPELWLLSDPVPPVFFEIETNPKDWKTVAHSYNFERDIYNNVLVKRYGFPSLPLEVQYCSQRLALANSYPAELDLLAQALGLPYRKDPAARKAMLAVSRPQKRKRKLEWDNDPAKLQFLYERCKLDVITTRAVWRSLKLKPLSVTEQLYQLQDATINGRGVRCDRTFVTAARDLAIREAQRLTSKFKN